MNVALPYAATNVSHSVTILTNSPGRSLSSFQKKSLEAVVLISLSSEYSLMWMVRQHRN